MAEVFRQSCKRMEARHTLRNRLVVWFTAVLTSLSVLNFHIIIDYSVRLCVLFSTHCRRRCCGPVDVAAMSSALLVGGAHENML